MGIILTLLFFQLQAAHAFDCLPADSQQSSVEKSHLHVVRNSEEARVQFESVYNDSRRLKNRAYWSQEANSFLFPLRNEAHPLPQLFIKNLQNQLLLALQNKYADYVYYGDMGHLHLLVPKELRQLSLESPTLLSLFHTGELYQFKENGNIFGPLKKDPHWEQLYWNRNFAAYNLENEGLIPLRASPNEAYNTVRSIPGYKEIGTVYFSANKNGCFELKNKDIDLRFDISVSL